MGLKDVAQKLAQKAIGIVGNIAVDVAYKRVTANVYNPAIDANVETVTTVNVKGVLSKGKSDEDDSDTPLDQSTKVLIAALDLGVVPEAQDKLVFNGATWEIVKFVYDPAYAVYIFTVRVP